MTMVHAEEKIFTFFSLLDCWKMMKGSTYFWKKNIKIKLTLLKKVVHFTHFFLCECSAHVSIVSSPLKLGRVSCFWNLDKEGGHEKLLRNRGLVQRGGGHLRKRGVFKLFHQFSLRKACFHYYWIFLSGKYSRLL